MHPDQDFGSDRICLGEGVRSLCALAFCFSEISILVMYDFKNNVKPI